MRGNSAQGAEGGEASNLSLHRITNHDLVVTFPQARSQSASKGVQGQTCPTPGLHFHQSAPFS
jgi:hypothetical protein